jgi:hypothetical protein
MRNISRVTEQMLASKHRLYSMDLVNIRRHKTSRQMCSVKFMPLFCFYLHCVCFLSRNNIKTCKQRTTGCLTCSPPYNVGYVSVAYWLETCSLCVKRISQAAGVINLCNIFARRRLFGKLDAGLRVSFRTWLMRCCRPMKIVEFS